MGSVLYAAEAALAKICDAQPMEQVITELSDKDDQIRYTAAGSLARFRNAEAVEALVKALGDHCGMVGGQAGGSLTVIGKFAPELLRQAYDREKDEKMRERLKGIIRNVESDSLF
jgi:HEAT repeat protein